MYFLSPSSFLLNTIVLLVACKWESVESFSVQNNRLCSLGGSVVNGRQNVLVLHAEDTSDVEVISNDDDDEDDKTFPVDENAPILEVKNLVASINEKKILKDMNLKVNKGEIHAIMGTNGSGKSTFSKVLVGHPAYEVDDGDILYKGSSILELEPEERSHLGLFLAFQYPIELPGVSNEAFLRLAYNSKQQYYGLPEADPIEFLGICNEKLQQVKMDPRFLSRNVNEGFSGGEKKRNEILQMILLDSQLSILDETDSGLDIDALKTISDGINNFMGPKKAIILITHYQRLLDYVNPDFVHVMKDGVIVKTGTAELAKELEAKGYEWLE